MDGNVSIGNLLSGRDSRMDRHGEKTGVRKNAEYTFNVLFLTRYTRYLATCTHLVEHAL